MGVVARGFPCATIISAISCQGSSTPSSDEMISMRSNRCVPNTRVYAASGWPLTTRSSVLPNADEDRTSCLADKRHIVLAFRCRTASVRPVDQHIGLIFVDECRGRIRGRNNRNQIVAAVRRSSPAPSGKSVDGVPSVSDVACGLRTAMAISSAPTVPSARYLADAGVGEISPPRPGWIAELVDDRIVSPVAVTVGSGRDYRALPLCRWARGEKLRYPAHAPCPRPRNRR